MGEPNRASPSPAQNGKIVLCSLHLKGIVFTVWNTKAGQCKAAQEQHRLLQLSWFPEGEAA